MKEEGGGGMGTDPGLPFDEEGGEPVKVEDEVYLFGCGVLDDGAHTHYLLCLLQEQYVGRERFVFDFSA